MSEDYAPSMASTAYSSDNNDNDDQSTSDFLAEIQKLESILLKQLDKETSRFGSSSSTLVSSSSSSGGLKGVGSGGVDIPSSSSPIDLDDGASSINFSQYLDAAQEEQEDAHSSAAGGGGGPRSTAQSSAYWSQMMDGRSTTQKDFDEASDLLDNQSCTSLRKELSQVVTPYGHVSQRVQAYEDLTPPQVEGGDARFMVADETSQQQGVYRTGTFAGTDGSVVGSVASTGMEEITQRTAALSTATVEDVQSTASSIPSHAPLATSTAPNHHQIPPPSTTQQPPSEEQQALLSQTQKIKSLLQNLEAQLTQVTAAASNMTSSPSSMGLEIQNSIRSLSFLEDSLKQQQQQQHWKMTIPEEGSTTSSSFAAHSRTRLHNIRQKLWGGGPSPVQQQQSRRTIPEEFGTVEGDIDDDDDDVDKASVVGQVSTDIIHHYPPPTREQIGCCDPPKAAEDQPVPRPREDYFSAAYQNAFACSSAYHLDIPEPGTANLSSTPNATGGKNYYYYYPPPEAPMNAAACCRIPPVETLLTALKRLEVKVASSCRQVNHLRRRQQQHYQQRYHPDGGILQQYELADLDLSNPARAERYHEL